MRPAVLAAVWLCALAARAEPGWSVQTWTTEDGLPVNGLTDLAHTPDGFLWIATVDGLVRFDGVALTPVEGPVAGARLNRLAVGPGGALYAASSDRALFVVRPGGRVEAHPTPVNGFARRGDALWLGTDDGLFEATAEGLRPLGPPLPGAVTGARDGAGRLWVGGRTGWLSRVEGARVVPVWPPGPRGPIYDLWPDPRGGLWVGSNRGLHRVDGRGTVDITLPVCEHSAVFGFAPLPGARPLLVTGCGLWRLAPDGPPTPLIPGGSYAMIPRPVLVTADGARSVRRPDGLYVDGRRLVEGRVTAQLATPDGSLWAVTDRGTLTQLRRQVIGRLGGPEGACNAYGMHQDRAGDVWVACLHRDLLRFRGGRLVEQVPQAGVPPGASKLAVVEDHAGRIWTGGPLAQVVDGRAIPTGDVDTTGLRSLFVDRAGALWVGAPRGLYRRTDAGRLEPMPDVDGRPILDVAAAYEAPDGRLWFASRGRGLARFDPADGRAVVFGPAQGLPSRRIRAIHPATGGGFWLGTEDRGLLHLRLDGDRARVTEVRMAHGLYTDHVHQILPDGRGRLWMSSNRGLFWLPEAELLDFVAGRRAAVGAVAYDTLDGMPHREANGGAQASGLVLRDGRLAFPTQAGVVVLDPAGIGRDPRPPKLHIERVEAGGARLDLRAPLRLEPDQRDLTVTYTAPVFRHPERVRFRYRLEGFDDGWVEAGDRRRAFYTQVPPGRYRFRVTAANADHVWSPEGAALDIEVVPRFYETRGFAVSVALLLLGLVAGLWRLRFARMRARADHLEREVAARTAELARQAEALEALDELKTRFFAHISHELRTPLTLIAGAVDRLPAAADEPATLGALRRNTRRLRRLTDQILALQRGEAGARRVTLEPVDLGALARATVAAFAPVAETRALTARGEATALAHPELVETVLVNLVSNAVKFTADGGRVTVRAEADGDRALLVVEDDGRGMPAADLPRIFDRFYRVESATLREGEGTGLGLALVRELAHQMNGEVEVESELGRGTRFTVRLMGSPVAASGGDWGDRGRAEAALLAAPTVADDPDDGRPRVLVVDDNADLRRWVGEVLGGRCAVLYAEDGVEGVERARAALPDVVVADVMMPRLDGFGLVQALLDAPETACIPVLLLTARVGVDAEAHGLRAGAVDFMTKPFDVEVLRARVEGILARRARLRDALRAEIAAEAGRLAAPGIDEADGEPRVVDRARAAVEARIDDADLDVEGLARTLGMSRATLARRLADEGAPSPGALIREVRLERAHALLVAGRGNVSEVAFAVGFNSLSQFSRSFKSEYGVPPSRLKSAA